MPGENTMACRDDILQCAKRIVRRTGRDEFTIQDITRCMQQHGTKYSEQTIRMTISSRMWANPKQYRGARDDLERVRHGVYRLKVGSETFLSPIVSVLSAGRVKRP